MRASEVTHIAYAATQGADKALGVFGVVFRFSVCLTRQQIQTPDAMKLCPSGTLNGAFYLLAAASFCLATMALAAELRPQAALEGSISNAPHLWKPVADEVFLQEVGEQFRTDQPVTCVAVYDHTVYAVVAGVILELREGALRAAVNAPKDVRRLRAVGGALWAATAEGAFRFTGTGWEHIDTRPFNDFCLQLGQVCAATREELFRFESGHFVSLRPPGGYLSSDTTLVREDFSQTLVDAVQIGPVNRIASYSGTMYLLRPGGLALIEGRTFVPDPVDWGALPSPVTRDLLALGSRLYIATDRGLAVLRGMAMTVLRGPDGLPYEDTTCLAQGFDGDLWIGTTTGAIRQTGDEFHYFGARHWLPGNNVRDIAVAERTVYIATDAGLGIIRYEPFTLLKKAAWFERELDEWGMKRLGFIHKLYWGGDTAGWLREISDNDGGNTAHYLAAMTFKYAATGDERARHEANEAFNAMLWLGEITPKPGFIARAIWSVKGDTGERATRGSGGLPAKWYPTEDGLWLWKGDTSSDEVNAHMYAVSLFYELGAKGAEKDRARRHIANIASHILDNGWALRDMDGSPTRWGRWDPDYLLRPYGFESRGLNGMEAQTYMQTAYALTGDARFQQGLQQLLTWRYQIYTVRQRLTFPPDQVAPWDDELAFFCYHPLLRYTKEPDLRSIYLRSLERTWEILRRHQLPFFNFSYGALTGNDCEAPQAVKHLREWSLDLVNHNYRNSHRSDLAAQHGYEPYSGGARTISPRESEAKWGDRSPLEYDGGEDSKAVTPPIGWLEDYWMGRYYGFIEAPKTGDPRAVVLPERAGTHLRAVPYAGPPRPPGQPDKSLPR
jgi:hypothetical protein